MRLSRSHVAMCCLLFFVVQPGLLLAWMPDDVALSPAVRMPGTQPNELSFELTGPEKNDGGGAGCLNCHGENQLIGNPPATATTGYPWVGSMMGQAARDPIFWATMTVALQDSVWALGNADAGDLCLRCHFPEGWLGGRSGHNNAGDLNASAMMDSDYDGVHCDVCHMAFDPFYEDALDGSREGVTNWAEMPWDETPNPLLPEQFNVVVENTYLEDREQAPFIGLFNGSTGFYLDSGTLNFLPKYSDYNENAGGQMFMSDTPGIQAPPGHSSKRGPFINGIIDGAADHEDILYSRYHKSKFFCSTCHDVSNPVIENLGLPGAVLVDNSGADNDLISEQYAAHRYGHVERTFSEFMLSAYGQPGGAATTPEYASGDNSASIPGVVPVTWADKCQDCHMADVNGGIPAGGAAPRPTPEHPNSGSPAHDFQGGNLWMTRILASLDHESNQGATYDPVNFEILTGGDGTTNPPSNPTANVATHTLDITQGVGLLASDYTPGEALGNAADRAAYQLRQAATIKDASYDKGSGMLTFKVQNNTGHKLISGYPEGRRMYLNVVAYDPINAVMHEVNPYDETAGTIKGLSFDYFDPDSPALPAPASLGMTEEYNDALVYEMKQNSTLTEEDKTFHFVLATGRTKDNRIPPKGFDIAGATDRLVVPVEDGDPAPDYFSAAEYAGGYDEVSVNLPPGADHVDINLYYQGTSREYVEFLRNEIKGDVNLTLYGPDNLVGGHVATYATENLLNPDTDNAYLIQTDPFFAGLRGWGDTIWALWKHNIGLGTEQPTTKAEGLTPFLMTSATVLPDVGPVQDGEIYAPAGGEIVASSDTMRIAWVPFPGTQKYKVLYSLNNQASWKKAAVVKKAFTYSTTIFDWLIPQVSATKDQCFVKVKAIAKSGKVINVDVTDAAFSIIPTIAFTNPPADGALVYGTDVTVSWDLNSTNPEITAIDLQYRKAPSAPWINIVKNLPGATGSYLWTVPTLNKDKLKASLRLKVKNANGKKMAVATVPVQLVTP